MSLKAQSEVAQSCPTLCDPMNCSLPSFSVHGIFQARVLEWVAISFPRLVTISLNLIFCIGGSDGKASAYNAGELRDAGSIPGLERCPGGDNGNPLQYSCLENPMDREAWRTTIHRVTKSWPWLSNLTTTKAGRSQAQPGEGSQSFGNE